MSTAHECEVKVETVAGVCARCEGRSETAVGLGVCARCEEEAMIGIVGVGAAPPPIAVKREIIDDEDAEWDSQRGEDGDDHQTAGGARRYRCGDCPPGTNARDNGFRQKKQLTAHRAVVHKAPHLYLPCPHPGCDRTFVCRSKLDVHQRRHAVRRCADCAAEFSSYKDLRRHRSLEHQPPVACPQCDVQLACRAMLRGHLAAAHRNTAPASHPCPYPGCGRAYTLARNLNQHVRSRHLGARHPCPRPGCSYTLCTKQKLRMHLLLHDRGRVMRPPPPPRDAAARTAAASAAPSSRRPSRVGLLKGPRRRREQSSSSQDSDNSLVRLLA